MTYSSLVGQGIVTRTYQKVVAALWKGTDQPINVTARLKGAHKNVWSESYYNLSNVCLFVCLFVCSPTPPRSLGRSSPNLEGRWRPAPDISLRGSFFERSRSSRSNVKFMGFFLFVPLLLPGPWADLHQTWWEG